MSTPLEKPENSSYNDLYDLKVQVCEALGLDVDKLRVESVLIESGGYTVKTRDSKHYFLPTRNFRVEDWIDVTDEKEHCE